MIVEFLIAAAALVAVTALLTRQTRWRHLNKQEVAARIAAEKREERAIAVEERKWVTLEAKPIVEALEAGLAELEKSKRELEQLSRGRI